MAKRKRGVALQPRASPAEQPPNRFEQIYTRKKFSILGRKVKGTQRRTGQQRSEGVTKRKGTLLVEYQQQRKANTFLDRRFGENDASLTEEDKAVARFQKQRMRDLTGGKFALPEEGGLEEALTHLGQSLASSEAQEAFRLGEEEEEADADLDAAYVREHHFGGGFVPRAASGGEGGEEGDAPPAKRSKKEVMEEVMAKAKAHKAERQQQRDADLDATEALDASFSALLQSGSLASLLRADKGKTRRERQAAQREADAEAGGEPPGPDDAAYDRARRELVFEAKAQAGERTLSGEELAALEVQRLEALEAERRARLRAQLAGPLGGDDDDPDLAPEGDAPLGPVGVGGYKGRRLRQRLREQQQEQEQGRQSGEAGEGSSGGEESGEGAGSDREEEEEDSEKEPAAEPLSKLEQRQRERAAGDHELQGSFRVASARLLQKYGVKATRQSRAELAEAEEEGSEGSGSSGEEQEEEGSDEGEEEPEAEGASPTAEEAGAAAGAQPETEQAASASEAEGEEGGEEDDEDGEELEEEGSEAEVAAVAEGAGESEASSAAESSSEEEEEEEGEDPAPGASAAQASAEQAAPRPAQEGAASSSGRRQGAAQADPARQLPFVLKLPGSYEAFAQLVAGRDAGELQEAIARIRACNGPELAAHGHRKLQELYGVLAQHFALRCGAAPLPLAELDVLTRALAELTAVVPLWATTVARARLGKLQERLAAALKEGQPAWPGPRGLLQLRLWAVLFPLGDRRHPVITPLALLAGAYLGTCPVGRPSDVAEGLFLCSLVLDLLTPAKRFMPEPLTFAVSLLRGATPAAPGGSSRPQGAEWAVPGGLQQPWLVPEGGWASLAPDTPVQPLGLQQSLASGQPGEPGPHFTSTAFRLAALAAALGVLGQLGDLYAELPPFPELMAPAVAALQELGRQPLPQALEEQRAGVMARIEAASAALLAERQPLAGRAAAAREPLKLFTPRFEEGYQRGKDYDPDRTRAETRKLQRQLQKERRGAMRELRRDATFLAGAKEADEEAARSAQRAQRRANHGFLERQEADMKSGGQGGMFKKRKKGRR